LNEAAPGRLAPAAVLRKNHKDKNTAFTTIARFEGE
jgi:hypothetical protein